jgi:signal transduction histidine kinase
MNFKKISACFLVNIILYVVLVSCQGSSKQPGKLNFTDSLFRRAEAIAINESGIAAKKYVDSLYAGFRPVSIWDRFRYYEFKHRLMQIRDIPPIGSDSMIILADSTMSLIDSSIALIEENNLTELMKPEYARSLKRKGESLLFFKRIDEGYYYLYQSREKSREMGDSCNCGPVSYAIAEIPYRKENYEEAIGFFQESIRQMSYCERNKEWFYYIQAALDNTGLCFEIINQPDSALVYFNRTANFINSNKDIYVNSEPAYPYKALFNVYENVAKLLLARNKEAEARPYILKCDSINKEVLHDELLSAQVNLMQARYNLETGNSAEAHRIALSEATSPAANHPSFRLYWLKLMEDISHARNEPDKELLYQTSYYLQKDSLSGIGKDLEDPGVGFERLEKKYELKLLDKKNQRQKISQKLILASAIFLTVLLSAIFFREIKLRRLLIEKEKRETDKLKEALFLQEMQKQAEQAEAIMKQRQKISADLHDELSNSLAALRYFVEDMKEQAPDAGSRKMLGDIEQEARSIYQNARKYLNSLKKNSGENRYDVVAFLDDMKRKFSEKNLLDIELDIDREMIQSRLNTHQHNQLYHIVKESISNIIRHAHAGRIHITIQVDKSSCHLVVEDNGRGFKEKELIYGIGLNSIRNRLADMGGILTIASGKKGTVLTGHFPVEGWTDAGSAKEEFAAAE